MKQENPGLQLVTAGAAIVAGSALAIGLVSASGCSNVIGLNKDYYEAEAGSSCVEVLKPVAETQHCPAFMKSVPGPYCIDLNEVTWADYEAFLGGSGIVQFEGCQTNDLKPAGERPVAEADAGTDNYPVAFVDWCDAWAYCNAKGKRLCGEIGTGAARSLEDSTVSCTEDEWYAACSAGGRFQYAEGSVSGKRFCNVPGQGGKPAEVGSFKECTTGHNDYLNIRDMNGNVAEWVDQCSFDPGTKSPVKCKVRGGAFEQNLAGGDDCNAAHTLDANKALSYVGFRCCADVITSN